MKTDYEKITDRHQKELNKLPITYAFNDEQLKEALKRLGASDIPRNIHLL